MVELEMQGKQMRIEKDAERMRKKGEKGEKYRKAKDLTTLIMSEEERRRNGEVDRDGKEGEDRGASMEGGK